MNSNTDTAGVRPRRTVAAAFVAAGLTMAVVGLWAGPSLAYTGPEPVPSTPESNDPSYWGDDCFKRDVGAGLTWVADADYSVVVLKAGQIDWVYRDVKEGDVLTVGGQNDISHFILCPPTAPTTTTTVAETTTTAPAPTTTVAETTTSEASGGPTTTVAETTTSVASGGPTSTVASELPATGSDLPRSLLVLGALLVSLGAVMFLTARQTVSD